MVSPTYFDVEYAINPHMLDGSGQLQKVDQGKAHKQWHALREAFEAHGLPVQVVDGVAGLPDMVFAANQSFPFYKNGRLQFALSRMKTSFRQQEVLHFKQQYFQENTETYEVQEGLTFESMGDAIWNYETNEIFGGYGFRSDEAVYDWLSHITKAPVIKLCLINEKFYHLDTALGILNRDSALVVEEAFSSESMDKIKMKFKNLLRVPLDEASQFLAANACSIDGQTVFVEAGALKTQKLLKENNFNIVTFDTSEYLKSGGSIFCLKMLY
jgi:N-dimethylarginine dimethylaminohydrolase